MVEARTYSICRNGISIQIAFEMVFVTFNLTVQILGHLGKWICISVMELLNSLGCDIYVCVYMDL